MGSRTDLKTGLLSAFSADRPRSAKEIVSLTGIMEKHVWDGLAYWWKRGKLLRSESPIFEPNVSGKRRRKRNTRAYYLYVLTKGRSSASFEGRRFVPYSEGIKDARGARVGSKAQAVMKYLMEHGDTATFSTDIAKTLKDKGMKPADIMGVVRRHKDSIYVRGYRTDENQTPFKEGYLLTYVNQGLPRE